MLIGEEREMGSVRIDGEDESQPSKKLLNDCGAVNYASVPRKLRSAIKRRRRESITLPLPISRKQRRVSNGAKKSRLIMKQGQITKDEEEVAETLNALADMFSDVANTNKPVLGGERSKVKSSTIVEAGNSITAAEDSAIVNVQEESEKMNTRVALEAANHSSGNVENFRSLNDRPKMFGPDMIRSCERMISRDEVSLSEIQYGKYLYTNEDKYKGLLTSPSLYKTGVLGSETRGSCLGSSGNRFPAWSENTSRATQPSVVENSFIADKIQYPQVVLEPKKLWNRCSAHVCIARLTKVLQKSETSKGLMPRPTQLTTSGGIEQELHTSIDNQNWRINGSYSVLPFNGFTHSASEKDLADAAIANLTHDSLHQNQQQYSNTSAVCSSLKPGSEFLSLAAGGSDTSEGINRSGYGFEASKQFHASYQHPRNLSSVHFSLPRNGYSSTFSGRTSAEAAPQAQFPPYYKLESQQQKWTSQYNRGGVATEQPDWQNRARDSASLLNYAQALFPHLHSAIGSMNQHFSSPQLQLMPSVNSSLALSDVERHHRRLNPAFKRNGAVLYSDNIQLLCNQHL